MIIDLHRPSDYYVTLLSLFHLLDQTSFSSCSQVITSSSSLNKRCSAPRLIFIFVSFSTNVVKYYKFFIENLRCSLFKCYAMFGRLLFKLTLSNCLFKSNATFLTGSGLSKVFRKRSFITLKE